MQNTSPSNSQAARNWPWLIAIGACVPFSISVARMVPLESMWQRALVAGLVGGTLGGLIAYRRQRSLRARSEAP